jgi:hypothetical protein
MRSVLESTRGENYATDLPVSCSTVSEKDVLTDIDNISEGIAPSAPWYTRDGKARTHLIEGLGRSHRTLDQVVCYRSNVDTHICRIMLSPPCGVPFVEATARKKKDAEYFAIVKACAELDKVGGLQPVFPVEFSILLACR